LSLILIIFLDGGNQRPPSNKKSTPGPQEEQIDPQPNQADGKEGTPKDTPKKKKKWGLF